MADGHTRQDGGRCLAPGLAGTGCLPGVGRPSQLGDPPSLGSADTLLTIHSCVHGTHPPPARHRRPVLMD